MRKLRRRRIKRSARGNAMSSLSLPSWSISAREMVGSTTQSCAFSTLLPRWPQPLTLTCVLPSAGQEEQPQWRTGTDLKKYKNQLDQWREQHARMAQLMSDMNATIPPAASSPPLPASPLPSARQPYSPGTTSSPLLPLPPWVSSSPSWAAPSLVVLPPGPSPSLCVLAPRSRSPATLLSRGGPSLVPPSPEQASPPLRQPRPDLLHTPDWLSRRAW
jgi:hypothetical protein